MIMTARRPQESIRLHAYLNKNLGDDLLVHALARRYPDTLFWIKCSKQATAGFSTQKNVRRIPTARIVDRALRGMRLKFRVNDAIEGLVSQHCCAVVHLGGSIFIQHLNWKPQLARYEESIIADRPCFILDANFGPFRGQEYVREFGNFFSRITDVCFRDRYSAGLFTGLPNIRVAPDVVFGYESAVARSAVDGPIVGFSD